MDIMSVLLSVGSFGYTVAIVGFGIVIFALTLLVVVFTNIPKALKMKLRKKLKKTGHEGVEDIQPIEGNVNAAIGLALSMYLTELHDEESNIVTIKKVQRRYSPWSSKIYSTYNNWPVRR